MSAAARVGRPTHGVYDIHYVSSGSFIAFLQGLVELKRTTDSFKYLSGDFIKLEHANDKGSDTRASSTLGIVLV